MGATVIHPGPWYVAVGFGPCELPNIVSRSREVVRNALDVKARLDSSGWTNKNSRIYKYTTRGPARAGDIGHDVGQHGRLA